MTTEQLLAGLVGSLEANCGRPMSDEGGAWLENWCLSDGYDGTPRPALVADDAGLLDDLLAKLSRVDGSAICDSVVGLYPESGSVITVTALKMIEAALTTNTKLCTGAGP